MRAGALRDKITLLVPVPNDWGEHTEFKPAGTIHAEVNDKSGSLAETAGADTSKRVITVKIRFRKNLLGNERSKWFDQNYSIEHIERDKKRRFLILTCESVQ